VDFSFNPLRPIETIRSLPGRVFDAGKRAAGWLLPDRVTFAQGMPPYTELSPAERARAEARSGGLDVPQALTIKSDDPPGAPTGEPVVIEVHGSFQDLRKALEMAGWVKADRGGGLNSLKAFAVLGWHKLGLSRVVDFQYAGAPMSTLFLGGKPQVAGFETNNDHHLVRDHFRVFDSGRKDPQGRPIWQIAASRDTGIWFDSRGSHHSIETALDRERDMVMADLLGTGRVATWRIARGEMPAADRARMDRIYRTDGRVYVVELG
jgi:hypothetical protein